MQTFDAWIAQSAYITQGFGPVAFAAGTDGTVGTVKKRGQRAISISIKVTCWLISVNKLM